MCDELFTVRLEFFSKIVHDCKTSSFFSFMFSLDFFLCQFVLDNQCFERSLSNSRDASFFMFREVAKFLHKLCVRCLVGRCVPTSDDWFGLMSIHLESQEALLPKDFLERMRLYSKVESALKKRAARVLSDKKADKAKIDQLAGELLTSFCDTARNYLMFLIGGIKKKVNSSAVTIQGLACFDPYVLLTAKSEFAIKCFVSLYRAFKLRGWLGDVGEQVYLDEYLELRTDLQQAGTSLASSPNVIHDVIDYLVDSPHLQKRKHMVHFFKLSCLCLTSSSPDPVVIKYKEIDTTNPRCRLTDAILPVQSFLSVVPQSVPLCVSESGLDNFQRLIVDFGLSGFAVDYDPWRDVDYFGRKQFHSGFSSAYKRVLEGRKVSVSRSTSRSVKSAKLSPLKPAARTNLETCFGNLSGSEISQTLKELRPGSSKDN